MGQLVEFALNNPLLVGALVMALIAAIGNEVRLRGQAGVSVGPQEAVRLINQGGAVVDLRDAPAFAAGHIVDAVNLTAEELSGKAGEKFRKKKALVLVCNTGTTSAKAAKTLRAAGQENAWSLDGGMAAWQKENLPVVAAKTPKANA